MYLPTDLNVNEAVNCGKLINQAYDQFNKASTASPGPVAWSIQDGYIDHATFCALENGRTLPFGFVASKDATLYVVIRGTQTPLEWLDDGSIQPISFIPGWGNTTTGFRGIHDQIFSTVQSAVLQNLPNAKRLLITGHSLGAALANLIGAHLVAAGNATAENTILYTFSGPRVGDVAFAARFKQTFKQAWRIFNTEDLVPTLPLSTVESDPKSSLGLFESKVELILKFLVNQPPFVFQHVDEPVALTYNLGNFTANHDLTGLYSRLQAPGGIAARAQWLPDGKDAGDGADGILAARSSAGV
jgi:triacylglycerol lipase